MKTIFKKLILPIFLFAILICSTLYFTYGNKNSMERVKAATVSCTKPATPLYKGSCVCSCNTATETCVEAETLNFSDTATTYKTCLEACTAHSATGWTQGTGTLIISSYSCGDSGTVDDGICYGSFSGGCPQGWNPVSNRAVVGSCNTVSYTGEPQTLVSGGSHVSYKNNSQTDADTYTVTAEADSNYTFEGGSNTIDLTCTILPTTLTVTATDQSKTYDGTPLTADNNCTASGLKGSDEISCVCEGSQTNVGSSDKTIKEVKFTSGKRTNYSIGKAKGTLTVTAAQSYSSADENDVTADKLCKPNLVYTGAEQQIVSSTSGTGWTLSGYNQKDAGEYTITASLKSGYRWGGTGSGTKEFKCKIDPKSVEVKWSNNVFPHDGQQHSQTPSATLVEGETINASTGWTREYKKSDGTSLGTTAPSDEGSYTVTVTCKAITGGQAKCSNYKFTKTTASFVIGNAMTLNPTSGTINVGDTFTFELTNPAGGTVTWASSRPSVATVNSSGVVTGVSAGTTVITATTSTGSANATIVVEAGSTPSPDPEGIVQFEYDKYTCEVGKTITAVVRYANVSNPPSSPTVTSSNTSVATVSLMTPRECTGTGSTEACVRLDTEAIERCRAAGVTELTYERCISFYRSYYVNIACKATGTTTVTAALSDTLKAQTTVTANAAGSNVTVIFDANGGSLTNNGEPSSSLQITLTGTGTIAEALSNITVAREGYTFDGWYTEDEGGVRYDDSVTFGAIGVEKLYAHWIENNGEKYTLTYDANGGTACSPATLEVPANTPWGELCKPSRKGYDFAGWFTSKTGGRKITESVIATGNMTVYAQWSKAASTNANTGIVTPVIALLVVAIISTVTFLVVRKKRAQL
ncbi:MAG: InlB B-repeat-containing protein [Bacilli bacterium]|nr:InlB B-repeat-containing protein [Bacilli bacterium]